MYKIKKIKEEDELSFDEFMIKYGDQLREGIKKGELSQDLISNLAYMILDYDEWKKWQYQFAIERIFSDIMGFIYLNKGYGIDCISDLIDYITFLNNDKDFNYRIEYWNLEELCNKAYRNIYLSDFMPKERGEEFSPEHVLDYWYHLKNFKKYAKGEDEIKILNRYLKDEE